MMKASLLLICTTISIVSFSQTPSDLELWTGGGVKLKINKKWDVSLTEQFRFNTNMSTLAKTFTEIGLQHGFNKTFSLKGNYRYIMRPGEVRQHRVAFDANIDIAKKKKPLSFAYRLRYQNVLGSNKTYIRNKIEFGYNLSKIVDPSIGYELFFRLNGKNEFRVSRLTIGLDWRLIKPLQLSTYYRLQDDIFVKNPERRHIVGAMLKYKIELKKKKKAPIN